MNCPYCGSQLPDGSANCNFCGSQLSGNPQPQYTQQPQASHSQKPIKISAFDKKAGMLVYITLLLSLVILAISILLPLTTDIFDIPCVSFVLESSGAEEDLDESKEVLNKGLDQVERILDRHGDALSEDQEEAAEDFLDATKDLIKTFSLMNFRTFVDVLHDTAEELTEYEEFKIDDDEFESIEGAIGVIIYAVIGMFALPVIFTLLGGLLKSKGLTITALVFTVLTQLMLCGLVWAILSMIVYIFQAVLCAKAKKVKLSKMYA